MTSQALTRILILCMSAVLLAGVGVRCVAQVSPPSSSATGDENFAPNDNSTPDVDPSQPQITNLQTGLPLRVVLSPFRLGHLSLVSFSSYQGYDSNPNLKPVSAGSRLQSFSALIIYSRAFGRTTLDAQYHPFFLISSSRSVKDPGAASFDLLSEHPIDGNWSWTLGEHSRYSPSQQSTVEGRGFVLDASGGVTLGNSFLSAGRNFLENILQFTVRDQYKKDSWVDFHVNERFERLSIPSSAPDFLAIILGLGSPNVSSGSQEEFRTGGGITWNDAIGRRDTLIVRYDYSTRSSLGADVTGVSSHQAAIGWNHHLPRGINLSGQIGPIWSRVRGLQHSSNLRLGGSAQVMKLFRSGGVAFSFTRSDNFSGIISNSINDRYELSFERHLGVRWSLVGSGSFARQHQLILPTVNGELATASISYALSRNWSFFVQNRYLHVIPRAAPEKIVSVGFTWSWVPEKP